MFIVLTELVKRPVNFSIVGVLSESDLKIVVNEKYYKYRSVNRLKFPGLSNNAFSMLLNCETVVLISLPLFDSCMNGIGLYLCLHLIVV